MSAPPHAAAIPPPPKSARGQLSGLEHAESTDAAGAGSSSKQGTFGGSPAAASPHNSLLGAKRSGASDLEVFLDVDDTGNPTSWMIRYRLGAGMVISSVGLPGRICSALGNCFSVTINAGGSAQLLGAR